MLVLLKPGKGYDESGMRVSMKWIGKYFCQQHKTADINKDLAAQRKCSGIDHREWFVNRKKQWYQLSTAGCSTVKYILFLFANLIVMSILKIELIDILVYLSGLGSSNIVMYPPISLFTHISISETVTVLL